MVSLYAFEQKPTTQNMYYSTSMQVLEPAQAAVLMVAAYPANIDILALANLLAYRRIHGITTPILAPVPKIEDAAADASAPVADAGCSVAA